MMQLVYFGSGAFGLSTLESLARRHSVAAVVTMPDRPAGRRRRLTPTPIAGFAAEAGIPLFKTSDANEPATVERIHAVDADAFVVIAFGQKLGATLVGDRFAINLHASLLPRYRGAAPINWAIIEGETETGVSVIRISQRIDAGDVLCQEATPIQPQETAGELEQRLARMGPAVVEAALAGHAAGSLEPIVQDETLASRAPKLAKSDGTVRFDQPATRVRARVHGLTPWPGCRVALQGAIIRLARVEAIEGDRTPAAPGTLLPDRTIRCSVGAVRPLEVQPAGGRVMSFDDYCNGHGVGAGMEIAAL